MLTLSSPPRQKLPCFIYFSAAVWPIATSFLEGGGGRSGKGKPGFLNKNRQRYLKKSLMKTDCIGHRVTFFCFSNKECI